MKDVGLILFVGRSLRFVHLRWTSVGMTLEVCHCFGRNDRKIDSCFRGNDRKEDCRGAGKR